MLRSGVEEQCGFCREWLDVAATRCPTCNMPHQPLDVRTMRRSLENGADKDEEAEP